MNRLACLVSFGALALLVSGCGRPVGSVSGTVSYQGKPLKGGTVSFASSEKRQSFSTAIAEDGTYSIPDIAGGSYKVCVETESLKPPPVSMAMANRGPPKGKEVGPPPGAKVPEGYKFDRSPAGARTAENQKRYVQIPSKYSAPDQTDLTYEFKGGTETYNIELK